MDGNAKTCPQGVICGQTGASREMGHWISCAVNISTCTPGSRVRSAKNRTRCFLRLGTCAHCHAWCRTWQQVLRLALRGCTHDTCKVMPAQADHSSLFSPHVVLLLWTENHGTAACFRWLHPSTRLRYLRDHDSGDDNERHAWTTSSQSSMRSASASCRRRSAASETRKRKLACRNLLRL